MSDILVISTSNTCRGPMLEGFIRERLKKTAPAAGVFSRGINVVAPSRAGQYALRVMKNEYGIDIGGHIARPLSVDDMRGAAVVYTLSPDQRRYLQTVYPEYGGKITGVKLNGYEGVEPVDGDDLTLYKLCAKALHNFAEEQDFAELLKK